MTAGKYRLLFCASLVLATPVGVADTTLEMEVVAGEKMKQLVQVSNGRVRVASTAPGQEVVVLYREGEDRYQVLDGRSKTVMTFTPQQIQQTMQQASGMMQQMQTMMAEQMKNLSPEQRARIEQMMGKPTAPGERVAPQLRETRRTEQVGRWNCEVIEVVEANRITGELCVADAGALGISQRDFQTMNAFFRLMSSMADSVGQGMGRDIPFMGVAEMPGVPLRAAHFRGGRKDVMQLTGVSTDRLDAGLFVVPGDYKPAQFPAMPGMPGIPMR